MSSHIFYWISLIPYTNINMRAHIHTIGSTSWNYSECESVCVYLCIYTLHSHWTFFVWFFLSPSSLVTPHLFRSLCLSASFTSSFLKWIVWVLIGLRACKFIYLYRIISRSSWTRSNVFKWKGREEREKIQVKYINKDTVIHTRISICFVFTWWTVCPPF